MLANSNTNPLAANLGPRMRRIMTDEHPTGAEYQGTATGKYTTEEHLRAQQEQLSASTGKPLHDPEKVHPAGEDPGIPEEPSANPVTETPEVTDTTGQHDAGGESTPPLGAGDQNSGDQG